MNNKALKGAPAALGRRLGAVAVAAAAGIAGAGTASAAEHVVQMLNQGASGPMVFEPDFLKVNVGDTVVFQPTQRGGHNSQSSYVPDGAKSWSSPPDTEYKVEMSVEGVYVYVCQPHLVMGMAGVIQVGNAVNLDAATAAATQASTGFVMNKGRLSTALAKVQ